MHRIEISHTSRLSVTELFETLADHNRVGKVLGAPVKRIRDGEGDVNGVGSVRKVGIGPLGLEETVTGVEPNTSIDYRITRGGFPLKNHRGRLEFSESGSSGSRVDWTIEFDSHLPVAGAVVGFVLKKAIGLGLRRLG